MTREETKAVLESLKIAYPTATKQISDPKLMLDMWSSFFEGYKLSSVMEAVKAHIKTKKFFPTIVEIKELADRFEAIAPITPLLTAEGIEPELPFDKSGCVLVPCPYLKDGQTEYCEKCLFEGGSK